MFVFFLHLWNLSKNLAIFLAFSGSLAMKNNYIHIFFAVLVANFEFSGFAPKQKYTAWTVSMETVRSAKSRPRNWTNQSAQICPRLVWSYNKLLTIIPRARTGSESIVHEAEGRMGYWIRGHGCERNKIIVLVKSNYTWILKTGLAKISTHSTSWQFKTRELVQRPIKSVYLTPGSELMVPRSIPTSPNLK